MMKNKTIWFDFDNSPHVQILLPIASELKRRRYEILYTARNVSQTYDLLHLAKIEFDGYGNSFPHNKILKLILTFYWGIILANKLKTKKILCAVNHSSRCAIFASWLSRIPSIVLYDYEYVNSFFQNRFADLVLMPEVVLNNGIKEAGILSHNLEGYPGIKEQLYLRQINGFKSVFNIPDEKIVITIRLPGEGHYTVKRSKALFIEIINRFLHDQRVKLILLPRNLDQKNELKKMLNCTLSDHAVIPEKPIPTKDLILSSDLVLGSGGTMVREAAVLGVPAYSFFSGKQGAVDHYLEKQGRLTFIKSVPDISKIKIEKRKEASLLQSSVDQIEWICDRIEHKIAESLAVKS